MTSFWCSWICHFSVFEWRHFGMPQYVIAAYLMDVLEKYVQSFISSSTKFADEEARIYLRRFYANFWYLCSSRKSGSATKETLFLDVDGRSEWTLVTIWHLHVAYFSGRFSHTNLKQALTTIFDTMEIPYTFDANRNVRIQKY